MFLLTTPSFYFTFILQAVAAFRLLAQHSL